YQALLAVDASGSSVTFENVSARLEEADQALLARMVFTAENDGQEVELDYGHQCLESLLRFEAQHRSSELESRVKQAERAGDLGEALRAAEEDARRKR